MQKSTAVIVCLLTVLFGFVQKADSKQIKWFTNYEDGIQQAKLNSKPVLVLFTGSDWCTWCKKLDQEVLDKPELAEAIGDKFVFIKLDFPINNPLPADQTARNKQIQKQFTIPGYPTIVVLDGKQQKVIGTVGYRPGGPKAYADYLMNMVGNFGAYQDKMENLKENPLSGLELKHLYEQATVIGRQEDAIALLAQGLDSDQHQFFKLEKYRLLAESGLRNSAEAITLRNCLLASDPNNLSLTHYQIAIIDFDAMNKSNSTADATAAALIDYAEKFGAQDKDNLWRIQMVISQVYFDKHNLHEALKYAESSYQTAPAAARPEIATAIKQMQLLNQDIP